MSSACYIIMNYNLCHDVIILSLEKNNIPSEKMCLKSHEYSFMQFIFESYKGEERTKRNLVGMR